MEEGRKSLRGACECRGRGRKAWLLLVSAVAQWLALLAVLFYAVLRFQETPSSKEMIPIIYTEMTDSPSNSSSLIQEQRVKLIHRFGNMNLGNKSDSIIINKDGFYMVIVKCQLNRNTIPVNVKVFYEREHDARKQILDMKGNGALKEIMVENLREEDAVYMTVKTDEDSGNVFTSLSLGVISIGPSSG